VPQIAVVIPTRNRTNHLEQCLDAVKVSAQSLDVEVFVMDQSDGDDTRRMVESRKDTGVQYHRMPRNGACPARNLGAALATSPIVAFLDDDCCPRPDWMKRILKAFADDPELQFVFGQLKAPPNANPEEGFYPEYLPTPDWQRGRSGRQIAMVAAGANMSARKEFLLRIGGFDELLGPAVPTVKSNDSSISYKVLRSGEKWRADPDIEVVHVNGFRRHDAFAKLVREYDHGLGVNWARFARRGDPQAVWYFCVEHAEMTKGLLEQVAHLKLPRGVKNWFSHLKGFWDGIRLPGDVGYVDGNVLRRMSETRRLDP